MRRPVDEPLLTLADVDEALALATVRPIPDPAFVDRLLDERNALRGDHGP